MSPSTAAEQTPGPGNPARVVITASAVPSDRAATPAARRIVSAGHSGRGLPRPIVSTLDTGSDGTTRRWTCSLPPVASSARRPDSMSATASAGSSDSPAATTAPGLSSSPVETTGTINTEEAAPRFGSDVATFTEGL